MKHQNSIPVLLLKHARWVVIALLFLVSMCVSGKYTQEIFVQLFLWAGLGCCWNLNCGYCKRNSIGHAAFFGIGAYATALLYTRFAVSPWLGLERSKFGYQLIAIGEDTTAAEMLGVNSSAVMTKSFVESAVTTAIGGAIYTMYYLYIEPDAVFGMNEISLEFVLICLIGGMGLAFGPVLGAAILIPLSNILRAQFSAVSGLHGFLYGLIMLLVVLARPDGLLSLIGGIYQKFLARFTPAVATDQEKEAERVC